MCFSLNDSSPYMFKEVDVIKKYLCSLILPGAVKSF